LNALKLFALAILASLVAASAAETPPAAEVLALEDTALLARMEKVDLPEVELPYSARDLATLSFKLAPTVRPISDRPNPDYFHPFRYVFSQACAHAGANELDILVQAFARLDEASLEKAFYCLSPLAAACVRNNMPTRAARLSFPDDVAPVTPPPQLAEAPKDLVEAWTTYQRTVAAYKKEFAAREAEEDPSSTGDGTLLYRLVEDGFVGDAAKASRDLPKFHDYSAHCLDLDEIGDAKVLGMLVALLRQGRYDEAAGAALQAAQTDESYGERNGIRSQLLPLFKGLGVDWQAALVGRLVDSECESWTNAHFHRLLAQYGDDRAAILVNELVGWLPVKRRLEYLNLLAAFVGHSDEVRKRHLETLVVASSSDDMDRVTKEPISAPIQTTSLHLIEDMITPDCSYSVAFKAIPVFARTLSPSSRQALQILAQREDSWERAQAEKLLAQLEPER